MFYWKDIDGFRVRKLWTRNETVMSFDSYKDSQRIYDAFSNAWNCCSEFEFGPRDEDEMDSDDDGPPYGCFNSRERDPQPTSFPPLPPERPPSSSLADVPMMNPMIVERNPPPASLPSLSISLQRPPLSLLPPLADVPIIVERGLPPASLPDLSISPERPPSSLLPPLADVPVIVERYPPPTCLPGSSTSPWHPPSSPLPPEAMAIDGSDHPERDDDHFQSVPDPDLDLFNASKQDLISVHPVAPIVEPPPERQSLDELLYFQYGYSPDETLDQPMPLFSQHNSERFDSWAKICRSVGGQCQNWVRGAME